MWQPNDSESKSPYKPPCIDLAVDNDRYNHLFSLSFPFLFLFLCPSQSWMSSAYIDAVISSQQRWWRRGCVKMSNKTTNRSTMDVVIRSFVTSIWLRGAYWRTVLGTSYQQKMKCRCNKTTNYVWQVLAMVIKWGSSLHDSSVTAMLAGPSSSSVSSSHSSST